MALFFAEALLGGLKQRFVDDTFAGIHQFYWFDYCILIPYFLFLGVLAIYGSHRYLTVFRFWRHHKILEAPPGRRFSQLPRVTIQLPLFNERYVVERLLDAVSHIRYPRELLQIQVLDDSTDETHAIAERLVGEYRSRGVPIEYHHRRNRSGFKAGALEEGLRSATGEFIAIFDADFLPDRGFLENTIHYFTDPRIGMVQTRWTYINRNYSLLTEVQATLLDGHFILEHTARCGAGLFFNFNGTAGVLRRKMIEDAGGWQHDTLTEDSDLSYRAQLRDWKFRYLPHVESPSELPVETFAFQVQQARWAKGLTQVALKLLPSVFRSKISFREKAEAVFHLTPNISYPLMVLVSALLLPVMIVRFHMGWMEMLALDLPIILATFFSVITFYAASQRGRDPLHWKRSILLMPMLIAAGVGLTIVNSRAVLEALLRIPTEFARTAKYAIGHHKRESSRDTSYQRKSGLLPYLEILMGTAFLGMAYFAVDSFHLMAVPFLLMFAGGYYWVGMSTIHEEHLGRLRWERERQLAAEAEASK